VTNAIVTMTVRDFLKLGYTEWQEIHWARDKHVPDGHRAYQVGFLAKDGHIHPFATWIVENSESQPE
jgi:hypothetical protein